MNIETISYVKARLKGNIFIRIICFPFMKIKNSINMLIYKNSTHSEKIRVLKDKHLGKRCFVIGNGPSLKSEDLDKIASEYSFGTNRIFFMFDKTNWRPTFYCCTDKESYIIIKKPIVQYSLNYHFIEFGCKNLGKSNSDNVYYINVPTPFRINKYRHPKPVMFNKLDEKFAESSTVTFVSIQMAIYMGFKEIYLLGIDHSYSKTVDERGKIMIDNNVKDYFNGIPDNASPIGNTNASTLDYEAAKEYADTHGIKIYNATRGGKLEVFERIDFDSLFEKNTETEN